MNAIMQVGGFVLINQFILTLYAPLGFLGVYYRMIKQSLVDMENMFSLLDEPLEVRPSSVDEHGWTSSTHGAPIMCLTMAAGPGARQA